MQKYHKKTFQPERNALGEAPRAPFDIWLFNRRISPAQAAKAMGVNQSLLSRALMPPGAPNFKTANITLRRKVEVFTQGAVGLGDWPEVEHD